MVNLQGPGPSDTPAAEPRRTWNFVSGRPSSRREREQNRFVVRAYASRNRQIPSTSRTPSPKSETVDSPENATRQEQHIVPANSANLHRHRHGSPIVSVSTQSTCTYDPFETYPSDLPRNLIDRLMPSILIQTSQLLPPLKPAHDGESRWGDFTIAWLRSATHDKAMFHVALFASLYNFRMFAGFAMPQTRDELVCQQIVIHEISTKMNDPLQNTSNEALQAVGCLSLHPDSLPKKLPRQPRQGQFQELQMLHMYGGTLSRSNPHIRAMNAIIRAQGGINNVNWQGGPQLASYLDLLCANHEATRPLFPFVTRLEDGQSQLRTLGTALRFSILPNLGTGFTRLEDIIPSPDFEALRHVLASICDFSRIIASYSTTTSPSLSLGVLGDMRNSVQHALLSLSPLPYAHGDHSLSPYNMSQNHHRTSGITSTSTSSPFFGLLFSSVLIYTWLITFPAPLESMPLAAIARVVLRQLRSPGVQSYFTQAPDLLLWINMMGTLASFNTLSFEALFLRNLAEVRRRLELTTWEEAEDRLQRFLWVTAVNGIDGWEIWERVKQVERGAERPDPQFW
jgi:hypothetical protein